MRFRDPIKKHAWNAKRIRALELIAAGDLTLEQIAQELGASVRTVKSWKASPQFQEKLSELMAEVQRKVYARGLAVKIKRVAALNDRWERMQRVISERAADPAMASVPGGTTGLLVRRVKSVGFGDNNQMVEEYEFDASLLRELRETEKQAAQELGQWDNADTGSMPSEIRYQWVDRLESEEVSESRCPNLPSRRKTKAKETEQ